MFLFDLPGMGDPESCYRCGRSGHWSKECPRIWNERGGATPGFRERGSFIPPPPPPGNYVQSRKISGSSFYSCFFLLAFLRDRIIDGFRDFDYYDRREEYARDMFERRYPPMSMRSGRERPYDRMPERMPPPPPMAMTSMRGPSRDFPSSREMFTRRSPPSRSMNSRGFGMYEDFSRDSFDDRRPSGMRGASPTHRYAPY